MSILTFPAVRPASVDWQFSGLTQTFTSPFTNGEQTAQMPGSERWVSSLAFNSLTRLESRLLEAFLVACRGAGGRFYLWNHARENPLGAAGGNPVVDGAGNYGGLLATRGWTPNTAGILLAGDYIGVNNEVKMVLADASSDANGKASLAIGPNIRNAPSDGMSIATVKPQGLFRLQDDNQGKMAYRKQVGSYQFVCVETWS